MTPKVKIIESNHMDYASARVQFMLGSFLILSLFLCFNQLTLNLFVHFASSILVGLLFFEISNRYSNKIQATAAIWASLIWFILSRANNFEFSTWSGILPVFLYLRFALLNEKKYNIYFLASLLLSFVCGFQSLVCSLSGTILASIFLPRLYSSNPTIDTTHLKNTALGTKSFFVICTALAVCYLYPLFLNKVIYSNIAPLDNLCWLQIDDVNLNIVWIYFAALFLVRLFLARLYMAPILFCAMWALINTLPHPQFNFFQIQGEAQFYLVPIAYLIVMACLPVFDVLNRKNSLILALSGSLFMSLFCICKSTAGSQSFRRKTHNDLIEQPIKQPTVTTEQKLVLSGTNLTPKLIGVSNIAVSNLSGDEWISQSELTTGPWYEKTNSYLNLCAGPFRRDLRPKTKTISVNGYGFKNGVAMTLASVKINPREAHNVRITLAFPLSRDTRVNWLWKGNRLQEIHQAALESIDSKTLVVNLQNNPEWIENDSVEQIGLLLPAGSTSLAIEKIEL
ncbi:MAG: hypothetical protein SFY67_15835 [Candidatus Melainabacteria bacterium]|nr:hypothetical protein [Candidatus Melainabacteria bacterium]